jgi:large subunit ribosomal protein L23
MFKVKVDKVRILNMKGKTKRFGGRMGKRSDLRKAYVTLMPDNDIDFAGAN